MAFKMDSDEANHFVTGYSNNCLPVKEVITYLKKDDLHQDIKIGFNTSEDYEGQRLSEQIMQWVILIAAVLGFLAGYTTSSYRLMLEIFLGGVALAFLVAVPDWPWFNQHKLSWLPEQPPFTEDDALASTTLAMSKSKPKRSGKGKR